ncbi:hypothetical protein AAG906_028190 [Vitis piasezkii]
MRHYLTKSGPTRKRELGGPGSLTSPLSAISGIAKKASGAPVPLSEPQIPSEIAPSTNRCPMLTQPPIEGNLDQSSTISLELCFDTPPSNYRACTFIPPTAQIPHGASADPKRLLLPQSSHGFLSVHDY